MCRATPASTARSTAARPGALYPASATNLDGSPQNGGYLPNVKVTNLNLSIGAVNSTTGANVTQPGDSNLLTATTDGQGVFAIRLGPMIFPNSATQPQILGLDPSSFTGTVNGTNVTRVANPLIDGYTEQIDVRQRGVRQPLRHVESEQARADRRL